MFSKHGLKLNKGYVNDVLVGLDVGEARYNGSYYRYSAQPRKLTVKVGYFGQQRQKTFREKKDGSFSIDKIAEELVSRHKQRVTEEEIRAKAAAAREVGRIKAKVVREKFGLNQYTSTVQTNGQSLTVKLNGLSVDQASAILQAAINAGVKL